MNRKMVFYTVAQMVLAEALLLILPLATSLYYNEPVAKHLFLTFLIALVTGGTAALIFRTKNTVIYAKEGFLIVALSWIMVSAIGALPFWMSGEIPSYIDAFFETVSGFTTTGSSILTDVEAMSKGLLFWRSFTHWIGGMGVLVFVMAIIPNISDRSIHLMRAEMPGPVIGKLVPRAKDTAKILYLIYIVMTVIQITLLVMGKMPVFDSLIHAFGTAGTGGFGIKADSIAGYSPYLQWVITIFMALFGINFNIYYLLITKRFRSIFQSGELWTYLGIILVCVALVTFNIYPMYDNISATVRHAAFQVSSIITTTGYATTDFDLWPTFSKAILLTLMFIGASAGSTGGGLKVSRLILLVKRVRQQLHHMLHPRSVSTVKFEGKRVDNDTLTSVANYFAIYMISFFIIFLILCLEPFDIETNFSAAAACFNNIGPGLSKVGPTCSFAEYSPLSKIVLSFAMLLGRLEIFPLILTFIPSTWSDK